MSLVEFSQNNNNGESPFDAIRHFDEQGNEFWYARELMPILGYIRWERVPEVVERASISCDNGGNPSCDHFIEETRKTSGRPQQDFKLTRHACHLIAMCADPRKAEIAQAQTYFSVKLHETLEQKPKSLEEILLINAQALFDHKQRLDAIEQQKIPLLERKAEALEAQVLLLENQNHLLTEQNEILEEKIAEIEFEQRTQQMEIAGNSAELDRFRNGQGHWFTVMGYGKLKGVELSLPQASLLGRQASALCRQQNIVPEPVTDPRFGKVNSYPEHILAELQIF